MCPTKREIKFLKSAFIFTGVFDFLPKSKKEFKKIIQKLRSSSIVDGYIRYLDYNERAKKKISYGRGTQRSHSRRDNSIIANHLKIIEDVDCEILNDEYRESGRIVRVFLKGFNIKLPHVSRKIKIKPIFTLDDAGVGVISLWTSEPIKQKLTTDEITHILSIITKNKLEIEVSELPVGYAHFIRKESKDDVVYNELEKVIFTANPPEFVDIHEKIPILRLFQMIWGHLINTLNNDLLQKKGWMKTFEKLRTEIVEIYPTFIVYDTDPQYESCSNMIQMNKTNFLKIMKTMDEIGLNLILEDKIETKLPKNVSNRIDQGFFLSLESGIISYSKLAENHFNYLMEKNPDKYTDSKMAYFAENFKLYILIELLLIQKFIFSMLDTLISKNQLNLKPRNIIFLRQNFSKYQEIYFAGKLVNKSIDIERIKEGKEVFLFEKLQQAALNKFDFIDVALQRLSSTTVVIFNSILVLVLLIIPLISMWSPYAENFWNFVTAGVSTICLIIFIAIFLYIRWRIILMQSHKS